MTALNACVVAADMVTAYGRGIDACREGLLTGATAVSDLSRFDAGAFHSRYAATVPGLEYRGESSLAMQLLGPLLDAIAPSVPVDARLLLATTKGEIDFLETSVIAGTGDPAESVPDRLLEKAAARTGLTGERMVVSAACTSSSAALARGAALIRSGRCDTVLVAAVDSVTEFVYSGFSSLMALDPVPARPFDRNRAGLSVGEAGAVALLMSKDRALREGRPVLGTITGWGLSDDANHMTGPSRESEGLILAIRKALSSAGCSRDDIGFISAHGTGTPYNDAMEMQAFHAVFGEAPRPVYSVKGGIGHTMGAAGLVETLVALRSLREGVVPPTVNLQEPEDAGRGWVSSSPQTPSSGAPLALVTNAGFNGVNTALVLA